MDTAVTDEEFTARFEAAKENCLTGHDAGCTYGGMPPPGGYWLSVAGCPLDHGGACPVCGGEVDARFGDWEDGIVLGPIWGVSLCASCRERELARNPERWRAPSS